ncbi:MAG: zf-HC2 domain-containing protein [candidate division Zixibacteria bacterium]|nr:zf-HC2 domain-containing protein [candidate division Zixibacteria bacterium]
MNCRKASRLLSAYIEGGLSPKETDGFEAHLKACSVCRQKLADIKAIIQTAGKLEQVTPGPHFTSRLMCAINQQNNIGLAWHKWRYRLSLSGAAFVVAASFTFYLISPGVSTLPVPIAGNDSQIETAATTDSAKIKRGVPVSDEALKRDMVLTESPTADSISRDSITPPKHYVKPVGIKRDNKDKRIF